LNERIQPTPLPQRKEIAELEDENTAMFQRYEAEFTDAPRVNGIIVLPYTQGEPLTLERIKELSQGSIMNF